MGNAADSMSVASEVSPARSKNMRAIRSKDTKPELTLRKALHAAGFRYRLHVKELPGKPDLVFPRFSAVVEVRGCFWHAHTCADGHLPRTNTEYWVPKLGRNKERDQRNKQALKDLGYRVKEVWECEIDTAKKVERVAQKLAKWLERN